MRIRSPIRPCNPAAAKQSRWLANGTDRPTMRDIGRNQGNFFDKLKEMKLQRRIYLYYTWWMFDLLL